MKHLVTIVSFLTCPPLLQIHVEHHLPRPTETNGVLALPGRRKSRGDFLIRIYTESRLRTRNTYWKIEALFWAQAVPPLHEGKRQRIDNPRYWRVESLFWQNAYQIGATGMTRYDISDSDYWRCESLSGRRDGTNIKNSNR
ncbi:hypothetical protein GJ744_001252 [Endocarpon pusillum]|uniref:Uncharacterized protein n=1 Tax=Endocarpon pusillum TaxID=364733 RepID=A0A8H7ACE5_9EURO|nr:hypothetical protein GJ744_001252 [Endocarpon pusillum]